MHRPQYHQIKSSLYWRETKLLPPLPWSWLEVIVEPPYIETLNGRRLLVADDGYEDRILVLGTDENIQRMWCVYHEHFVWTELSVSPWLDFIDNCTLLHICEAGVIMDAHSRPPKKERAMEMRHYRKTPHISYKDHVTNEEVCAKIRQVIGPHKDLLTIVKRHKLQWYGHVSHSSGLAKPFYKAQWKGEEDKADRGRGGKTTQGNGQAWCSLSPRGQWRTGKMEETGCEIICGAPTTLAVKGYMRWDENCIKIILM